MKQGIADTGQGTHHTRLKRGNGIRGIRPCLVLKGAVHTHDNGCHCVVGVKKLKFGLGQILPVLLIFLFLYHGKHTVKVTKSLHLLVIPSCASQKIPSPEYAFTLF